MLQECRAGGQDSVTVTVTGSAEEPQASLQGLAGRGVDPGRGVT